MFNNGRDKCAWWNSTRTSVTHHNLASRQNNTRRVAQTFPKYVSFFVWWNYVGTWLGFLDLRFGKKKTLMKLILNFKLCGEFRWSLRIPVSKIHSARASPTSQLILQPFRRFTYITAHSPTLPLLHLRHSSFSNPSVASPTSQFILQPFFRLSYVTSSSLNVPGETPMIYP